MDPIINNGIVLDNFPTKELMARAKAEHLMVLAFIPQPESVKTREAAQAFQDGWLMGLGLEPNHRLALVVIPRNLDFESAKKAYLDHLDQIRTQPLQFVLKDFVTKDDSGDMQ